MINLGKRTKTGYVMAWPKTGRSKNNNVSFGDSIVFQNYYIDPTPPSQAGWDTKSI